MTRTNLKTSIPNFLYSMFKNALTRLFNYELKQASPIKDDFVQVEKRDEDGNVFTVYEKFDYAKHQASIGTVSDWALNSLLRSGVNPNFSIHTGLPTRLEGASVVASAAAQVESILNEKKED